METRASDIAGLKLPTWENIENREYHPWVSERIVINTANKPIEQSAKTLFAAIKKYKN